jgi:CBS domain containing-hemolysin-like protein
MRIARNVWFRCASFAVGVFIVWLLAPAVASAAGPVSAGNAVGETGQSQHLVMMIVYAAVALFFSFLCSVAEAVMLSISPSYIASLRKDGREKNAARLGKLKKEIDRSLAAILTLNTIAHTVGAGGAGAEAAAYFGDRYVGIAMVVLTLLILFLSEIIPKTLGALYWRRLAPITGQFVQWLIWVLYPLIIVSEVLTKWLSRGKSPHQFSRDEFAALVDVGAEAGQLNDTEFRILSNLFRFPDLCAEDIMTPRTVVFALQEDLTVKQVLEEHQNIGFSRIPVYTETFDHVTGFVLRTDVLLAQHNDDGQMKLVELKREIRGVHERTKLSRVLEELLDNRSHLLLVTDDYGGMEGIVTLEDVVETLIGIEIVDEADTIDDMRRLARQKWKDRMKRVGIDVRTPDLSDADGESGESEAV